MERAGTVIAKWRVSAGCVSPEDLARAAWQSAVGKKIAAHTTGINLVRTHLIVKVTDAVWRRQLFQLRNPILHNLEKILGRGVVEDLEFRVATRRIGPGRAGLAPEAEQRKHARNDDAEGIKDPVLRMIYRRDRKKASA